jgi:hypothetical protein
MFGFVDDDGNVLVLDGFHKSELQVADAAENIHAIREEYGIREDEVNLVYADPNIFRRSGEGGKGVGTTVARLFAEHGISMQRGANDIYGGIAKFQQYLTPVPSHEHPILGSPRAPYFYISDKCTWFINEISEYYWKRDSTDQVTDMPTDRNDHAMDAVKYLLTPQPRLALFVGKPNEAPSWMKWHEIERSGSTQTLPRHR